ncbi:MAG: type I pullulanase [Bacillota bacterium]
MSFINADNVHDYFSYGIKVGLDYTYIKLWVKDADGVVVNLSYNDDNVVFSQLELEEKEKNIWIKSISESLDGVYYWLEIERDGEIVETLDPWVKAVGTNSERGIIVNLDKTDPEEWNKDKRISINSPVDAVIYELHVKDFSIHPESGIENKGKYLGFTETGTTSKDGLKTGVDHLKELGITHVQLMPVFDFATVDDNDIEDYNWGYDPLYYNVPEGSYATDPSGFARIEELKKLIQYLHNENIGVIMDVVYNHTYFTEKSAFNKIAPGYFYRWYDEDELANGSGVGNEIATEKDKVQEFIVESVLYWAKEYHLDGFRFDLMGLIDEETMLKIRKGLYEIDPNILVYGEPWYALPPQLSEDEIILKGRQKGKGIGIFNDSFRNAIKGENDLKTQGFIGGHNNLGGAIERGVVGEINYDNDIKGFALTPEESINYISCHDNLTLWDKIKGVFPAIDEKKRIILDRFAQTIIMTSQGVPFLLGGEEFLRTKFGNDNSYNAGNKINALKWNRKKEYFDNFKYYQGLITLRRKHPAFRLKSAEEIRKYLKFLETPPGIIAFELGPYAGGDDWKYIIVIYNSWWDWANVKLGNKKNWNIVVDDRHANIEPFNTFKADEVDVPPHSAMVLYTNN